MRLLPFKFCLNDFKCDDIELSFWFFSKVENDPFCWS